MNATDQAIADYLTAASIDYTAALMGETTRDEWACDEWRVTFTKRAQPGGKPAEIETRFYTGTGHRKTTKGRKSTDPHGRFSSDATRPVTPTAANVLHSLLMDAQGAEQPFDYWAADYGYDTDSIKALNIYNACCEIRRQVNTFFTYAEREQLRAMLEDY